jgi:transposase
MGQAITYAMNQWDALCVYTTDGHLNIDNNAAENAHRRVAVGRKNWLFCGSDNGGRTAAVLFSFIATCERHKVDPFAYLRDVLTRIAAMPLSQLDQLLPHRWRPAASDSN